MEEVHPRGGVLGNLKGLNRKDMVKLREPSHRLPKSKVYVYKIEANRRDLGTYPEQEQI
jgi:hypothetical protein